MEKYYKLLLLIFLSTSALAGISVDTTRVIFSSENVTQGKSVGVSSSKQSTTPYLVKAQVIADIDGNNTNVPFVVTPSLFRLEPGNTNQLRIMYIGGDLPNDKETVFYFRTTAMPAGDKNSLEYQKVVGGALSVSTGTIIKLFYRPNGLSLTQQQAMANLEFTQKSQYLVARNPTPYFITLSTLTVDGVSVPLSLNNTMLAPFSTQHYLVKSPVIKSVQWQAINDYGAKEEFNGKIN